MSAFALSFSGLSLPSRPSIMLRGGVDPGVAGADAVEVELHAQRAAADVGARIELAQAERHRHFGAGDQVALFAEHVQHAVQRGRAAGGSRACMSSAHCAPSVRSPARLSRMPCENCAR